MKKQIPNLLTLCNILCGVIGIFYTSQNNLPMAAYCIFVGLLFDFLDGFVARLLKAYSEFGKQLDSLADMVTFGVLPGFLLYTLIKSISYETANLAYLGVLPILASAWRLAKFNIDPRQSDSFIGLPTPASAVVIASLAFLDHNFLFVNYVMPYIFSLLGLCIVLSLLMLLPVRLFALKFKDFTWANNQIRYSFLILSLILLLSFQFLALPIIVLIYYISSIIINLFPAK